MSTALIVILAIIGLLAIIIIGLGLKIVRQSTALVIERLGKFHKVLETGIHFIVPFLDRPVGPAISLKERVKDFDPQSVITKDNVSMKIDTVVYFSVTDPKMFTYGVEHPILAIEKLTATTIRNIVGALDLDATLTSRDTINDKMCAILDEATDSWGIKVNRVEIKNILPPKEIQAAMEKQVRADREKREAILIAEGEKQSNILIAQGEKEAAVLRAEAKRLSLIKEAEGTADAIKLIIDAKPDQAYLTLKGYEAMQKVADGQSTKLIIPTELAGVTSLLASLKESINLKDGAKKDKK